MRGTKNHQLHRKISIARWFRHHRADRNIFYRVQNLIDKVIGGVSVKKG